MNFGGCGSSVSLLTKRSFFCHQPQSASQFSGEPIALSPMALGSVENLVPVTGEGSFRAPAPLTGRSLGLKRVSRKSVTSADVRSSSCVIGSAVSLLSAEQVRSQQLQPSGPSCNKKELLYFFSLHVCVCSVGDNGFILLYGMDNDNIFMFIDKLDKPQ